MKTADAKAVKKSRLRAINSGTRYDVVGKLKWMARQIEQGKMGDVRDCVVGLRTVDPIPLSKGSGIGVRTFHWGTGELAQANHLLDIMKKEIT